jgi:hypothetical protein
MGLRRSICRTASIHATLPGPRLSRRCRRAKFMPILELVTIADIMHVETVTNLSKPQVRLTVYPPRIHL